MAVDLGSWVQSMPNAGQIILENQDASFTVGIWSAGQHPDCQLGNWIVILSLTGMLLVTAGLRLSVSTRWIPLLTLPSGTQRARSRIGDNDPSASLSGNSWGRSDVGPNVLGLRLLVRSSPSTYPGIARCCY